MSFPENLDRAITTFMMTNKTAFLRSVLAEYPVRLTNQIKIAAVNEDSIYFNEQWVVDTQPQYVFSRLLHEILHIIMGHLVCPMGYMPALWNIACDVVVENKIDAMDVAATPNRIYEPDLHGMHAIDVYQHILNTAALMSKYKDLMESMTASPDIRPVGNSISEELYTDKLVRIAAKSESPGKLSGILTDSVKMRLEDTGTNPVPWDSILRAYISANSSSRKSYKRFNRRTTRKRIYSVKSGTDVKKLFVAIDVSASMHYFNDDIYTAIHRLSQQFTFEEIRIVLFDDILVEDKVYRGVVDFKTVEWIGGGQTDIHPVIDTLIDYEPQFAVILTDGEFYPYPEKTPTCDVFWIQFNDIWYSPVTYGKMIKANKRKNASDTMQSLN